RLVPPSRTATGISSIRPRGTTSTTPSRTRSGTVTSRAVRHTPTTPTSRCGTADHARLDRSAPPVARSGNGEFVSEALGSSYVLERLIGRGAMGDVWRATDRRTAESVAAKLLRPELASDPDLVARFLQERSILVCVRGPH